MAITEQSLGRQQFVNYAAEQRALDKQVADILRDAAREAGQQLLRMPGEGIGADVRRFQYSQAMRGIEQATNGAWDSIQSTISGGLQDVTGVAVDGAEDLMAFLTNNLSDELADSVVAAGRNAAERVQARIVNDVDLSERVFKNQSLTSKKVGQLLNEGLSLGKSAREIATSVMDHIRPDVKGGMSFAANRLARTELNNAFHRASVENYKGHPWVEGVKWSLSGSHARPDICGEYAEDDKFGMGGGVFPKMSAPMKPHPNCLCYVTAMTPSPKEFGEKLLNGEYDDWLEDQGLERIGDVGGLERSGALNTKNPEVPWRASMTPAEADAYVKGTKLDGPFYHGTGTSNAARSIEEFGFDDAKIGGATGNYGMLGKGHYFTGDPSYARVYAGSGEVLETRLLVRNPMPQDVFEKMVVEEGLQFTKEGSQRAADLIQARGYDAIGWRGPRAPKDGPFTEVLVFRKEQIVTVIR